MKPILTTNEVRAAISERVATGVSVSAGFDSPSADPDGLSESSRASIAEQLDKLVPIAEFEGDEILNRFTRNFGSVGNPSSGSWTSPAESWAEFGELTDLVNTIAVEIEPIIEGAGAAFGPLSAIERKAASKFTLQSGCGLAPGRSYPVEGLGGNIITETLETPSPEDVSVLREVMHAVLDRTRMDVGNGTFSEEKGYQAALQLMRRPLGTFSGDPLFDSSFEAHFAMTLIGLAALKFNVSLSEIIDARDYMFRAVRSLPVPLSGDLFGSALYRYKPTNKPMHLYGLSDVTGGPEYVATTEGCWAEVRLVYAQNVIVNTITIPFAAWRYACIKRLSQYSTSLQVDYYDTIDPIEYAQLLDAHYTVLPAPNGGYWVAPAYAVRSTVSNWRKKNFRVFSVDAEKFDQSCSRFILDLRLDVIRERVPSLAKQLDFMQYAYSLPTYCSPVELGTKASIARRARGLPSGMLSTNVDGSDINMMQTCFSFIGALYWQHSGKRLSKSEVLELVRDPSMLEALQSSDDLTIGLPREIGVDLETFSARAKRIGFTMGIDEYVSFLSYYYGTDTAPCDPVRYIGRASQNLLAPDNKRPYSVPRNDVERITKVLAFASAQQALAGDKRAGFGRHPGYDTWSTALRKRQLLPDYADIGSVVRTSGWTKTVQSIMKQFGSRDSFDWQSAGFDSRSIHGYLETGLITEDELSIFDGAAKMSIVPLLAVLNDYSSFEQVVELATKLYINSSGERRK